MYIVASQLLYLISNGEGCGVPFFPFHVIVHREGCTNVNPMQKCSNGHYKVVGRTAIYFTLCIDCSIAVPQQFKQCTLEKK